MTHSSFERAFQRAMLGIIVSGFAVSAVAGPPASCGIGAGDCFSDNMSPGCDDIVCCTAICTADPFCCDTEWDQICADAAAAEPSCFAAVGACCFSAGNCSLTADMLDCVALGGTYQGDGMPCAPNPCGAANDECPTNLALTTGSTSFDLTSATDSGPAEASCGFPFGDADVHQDLWFAYTADDDGRLFVDTCGSGDIDTRLAVYEGCVCPPAGAPIECNDDWGAPAEGDTGPACPGTFEASLSLDVTAGTCYLIRVGSFDSGGGIGGEDVVNLTLVPPPCGPGNGSCFEPNGTPGCSDASCCDKICALDPFCCDVEWDQICVDMAEQSCPRLTLEAVECQSDQSVSGLGVQIQYELWMRGLDGTPVTGFQAFIEYDEIALDFESSLSSYTALPFSTHVQPMATANVAGGMLRLDGNALFDAAATGDAQLAELFFTVDDCSVVDLGFDLSQPFASELSVAGDPIATALLNAPPVLVDSTPPTIACPPDITTPADANVGDGCQSAVVTYPDPIATDDCTSVVVECVSPSGSAFPAGQTTTVICTATDECGNVSTCSFDVTVTLTNAMHIDLQLVGVTVPTTRCIHFVADDCGATADVELAFDANGRALNAVIEIPCGTWSSICAKDEQHTKWATGDLVLDGTKYVLAPSTPLLALRAGDTDNDGDVDINDVTLLLAQFGAPEPPGGCPWQGIRGADFSNNGTVAAEDYSLLTPEWLTTSECGCAMTPSAIVQTRTRAADLAPWVASRVDLNRDGSVSHEDVRIFEQRHGLPNTLSTRIEETERRQESAAQSLR